MACACMKINGLGKLDLNLLQLHSVGLGSNVELIHQDLLLQVIKDGPYYF